MKILGTFAMSWHEIAYLTEQDVQQGRKQHENNIIIEPERIHLIHEV